MTPDELVYHLRYLRDDAKSASHGAFVVELLDEAATTIEKNAGGVSVDLQSNIIMADGRAIKLSPQEAEFCAIVLEEGYASYREIFTALFGKGKRLDRMSDPRNGIYKAQGKVNRKLDGTGFYFKTERGKGIGICAS